MRTAGALMAIVATVVTIATSGWCASPLDVVHVRGGIYMIAGPGGNTTCRLVSTVCCWSIRNRRRAAARCLRDREALRQTRSLLNTNGDDDHVGGNAVAASGKILAVGIRVPRRCIPAAAPPSGPTKTYWRG